MKISEVLRGCEVARLQSVGHMTVIPLTSQLVDEDLVSPLQGGYVSNTGYGQMKFRNPTDNTMIVPSHVGYIAKQAAQDHAMTKAGTVKARSTKTYNDAACIESTQGGYLRENSEKRALVLPLAMREHANKVHNSRSYGKLWDSIGKLQSAYGIRSHVQHLKHFFEHLDKELAQFVAEFEPVPNQVGSIVLLDGKVVGLDRSPNHAFWLSIWPLIIRDCYGSAALAYKDKGSVPAMRTPLGKADSLAGLKEELIKATDKEYDTAKEIINGFVDDDFAVDKDETLGKLDVSTVSNDQFVGQVIRKESRPVYASLITKEQFKKHGKWYGAAQFSM